MTISSNFGSDITTIHQKRKQTACQMPVSKVVFEALLQRTDTAPVRLADFYFLKFISIGLLHLFTAEFVARSICRTKPSNRTNKASRFFAVVEALPRLLGTGNSNSLNKETSSMLYKFLLLGEKRLTIRIRAHSEQEARQRLQLSRNAVLIARTKGVVYA